MTARPHRDRDPAGRPRNARPRDALGRPLPPGEQGVEPVREDLERTAEEALAEAQSLIDAGRAFGAHEVFEAMWKQADDPGLRALWRGLAQLMVGLTHHQRGNLVGAHDLLLRGSGSLAEVAPGTTADVQVDLAAWRGWADRSAADAEAGQPLPAPPRLTAASPG